MSRRHFRTLIHGHGYRHMLVVCLVLLRHVDDIWRCQRLAPSTGFLPLLLKQSPLRRFQGDAERMRLDNIHERRDTVCKKKINQPLRINKPPQTQRIPSSSLWVRSLLSDLSSHLFSEIVSYSSPLLMSFLLRLVWMLNFTFVDQLRTFKCQSKYSYFVTCRCIREENLILFELKGIGEGSRFSGPPRRPTNEYNLNNNRKFYTKFFFFNIKER